MDKAINAQSRRPGIHGRALAAALPLAPFSCFALTAAYGDETAFTDLAHVKAGIWPYLNASGPATGMLLFLAVLAVEYAGFAMLGRAQTCDGQSEDGPTAAQTVLRARGWAIALGLILSLTLTIPPHNVSHLEGQLAATGTPPAVAAEYRTVWYWLYYIARYVGFAALITAAAAIALHAVIRADRSASTPQPSPTPVHPIAARLRNLFGSLTAGRTAIIGAIIWLCWLPWTVLLWPANIAADTVAQLVWMRTGRAWDPSTHEYLPGYALSDQHPWLDSLIYGAFDRFGLAIGSEAWGLWLLAFLQTTLCALALGLVINYLGGVMRMDWRFCAAATAFMALVPAYGRLMMSVVKDSTVMPFFLVLMVLVMEYIRRVRTGAKLGPWLIVGIVALSVLNAQMRKISLEIVAVTFIALAIVLVRRRLASLALAVVPVAIGMIISAIALPALHVAPGGKQEMIAIPLQQTAAIVVAHGDAISPSDRAAIDAVITCSPEQLDDYLTWDPNDETEIGSADAIKDRCFNREATSGDVLRYLTIWAKLAVLNPRTAVAAVPWLRDPFVMGPVYDEGWYVRWGWEEMGSNMILPEYESTWTWADMSAPQKIGSAVYEFAENAPGVSLLLRENLYTVWVPLFVAACCCVLPERRTGRIEVTEQTERIGSRWRNLVYLAPWVLTILSLFLLPGHQTRYTWTLAFGVALIAAVPFLHEDDQD